MRMVVRMSVVDRIIQHFDGPTGRGGLAAFSRAMGHENPTTVQGWKERGVVPMRQIPSVIAVCAKHSLKLKHSEFFDEPPEQKLVAGAAAE